VSTLKLKPCPSSDELISQVCDRITSALEKGVVPWRQPWRSEMPQNLFSRRCYRGINYFLLISAGFGSPYWATEAQILKHRGRIRQDGGTCPTVIVYSLPPRFVRIRTGHAHDDPTSVKRVHRLGCHLLYNSEQTEGLDRILKRRGITRRRRLEAPEDILKDMPHKPAVTHNPLAAYFSPDLDVVSLPSIDCHDKPEDYYCTLFHELVHSTAMPSRLNRGNLMHLPADHQYSQEELVAEMGAAMLCTFASIEPQTMESSAGYIDHWLSALEYDKKMLYFAAMQAGKAFDFITNRQAA
jgi:antirestriction protein ArdC